MAQLVEALRYKPEGRGFDSRWYLHMGKIQLNMFRASSCPSSGATKTAVAAYGLPSELGDSSARPRPTALLPPRSDGKPEAVTAVVVAPDDAREDARNMLSCN